MVHWILWWISSGFHDLVKDFFTSASLALVIDLPFILIFVFVIYLIAGPLALVPLLAIPLVLGVGFLVQPSLNKISEILATNTKSKHSVVVESLSGLETINTTGSHELFTDRYEEAIEDNAELGQKSKMKNEIHPNSRCDFWLKSFLFLNLGMKGWF